jgi:hypothetical protein
MSILSGRLGGEPMAPVIPNENQELGSLAEKPRKRDNTERSGKTRAKYAKMRAKSGQPIHGMFCAPRAPSMLSHRAPPRRQSSKSGLVSICLKLRSEVASLRGEIASTAAYDLAQTSLQHDRPTQVIYVGDFDPSGLHMSEVDLSRRLERYGGDFKITRVAITGTQPARRTVMTDEDLNEKCSESPAGAAKSHRKKSVR